MPFLVGAYVIYFQSLSGQGYDKLIYVENYMYGQGVQVLLVHFLIFVSWKKGPYCWLVIAPYLFMGLAIATYIIIPAALTFYTHQVWGQVT